MERAGGWGLTELSGVLLKVARASRAVSPGMSPRPELSYAHPQVLAQQGEYSEAIPILRAALKLEPSNKVRSPPCLPATFRLPTASQGSHRPEPGCPPSF